MDCFGRTIANTFIGDVLVEGDTEIYDNLDVGGDLIIEGSLVVKDQVAYEDSIIILNDYQGRLNDSYNWGLIAPFVSGSQKWSGLLRSFTDSRFKLIEGSTTEPLSTSTSFTPLGSLDLLDAKASTLEATTSLTTPQISTTSGALSIYSSTRLLQSFTTDTVNVGEYITASDVVPYSITDNTNAVQGVGYGFQYRPYGVFFQVSRDCYLTHLALQTELVQPGYTSFLMSLWVESDLVNPLVSTFVANTDPVVNGCYTKAVGQIRLTAGISYFVMHQMPQFNLLGDLAHAYTNSPNSALNASGPVSFTRTARGNGVVSQSPATPPTSWSLSDPINTFYCGAFLTVDALPSIVAGPTLTTVNGPLTTSAITATSLDTPLINSTTISIQGNSVEQINVAETILGLGTVPDILNPGFTITDIDTEQAPYATWQIYGLNLAPTVDIEITHLGFHELLPGSSGKTNFYCRVWSDDGKFTALTPALEVKTSDTKIGSFYYAALATPLAVSSGVSVKVVCIAPGTSIVAGCQTFKDQPNIAANADFTYGVLARGVSGGYADEATAYNSPPTINTAQLFVRAGGFLYSKATLPAISLDTKINTNLNIVPRLTDTSSIGTSSLRYLDSEIKTMNSTELYFNATSNNKIWFPTTTGGDIGMQITDWTSQAFTDYARNGTHPSGLITHHVASDFYVSSVQKLSVGSTKILSYPPSYGLGDRYAGVGAPSIVNLYSATATTTVLGTLLNTDYDMTAGVFVGTKTIKANTVKAGDSIRCKMAGEMSWINNDSATFWIKLGATKMVQTTSVLFPAITGEGWDITAVLTFHQNSQASVNVGSFISFHYNDTAATKQGREDAYITAVDTTGDLDISIGVNFDQTQTLDSLITVIAYFDYVGRA